MPALIDDLMLFPDQSQVAQANPAYRKPTPARPQNKGDEREEVDDSSDSDEEESKDEEPEPPKPEIKNSRLRSARNTSQLARVNEAEKEAEDEDDAELDPEDDQERADKSKAPDSRLGKRLR